MNDVRHFLGATALLLGIVAIASAVEAIVGGSPVSDPLADAVVAVYDQDQGSLCSGALIAPRVVLTAAHCVQDPVAGHYVVLGGLNALVFPDFTVAVTATHAHPDYDVNGPLHDVGVLLLETTPPATPLPWLATDGGYTDAGRSVSVFGYGVTSTVAFDEGIRRGGVTSISQEFGDSFATDTTTGAGPCGGDAGGPILPVEALIPDTVIGVVSIGDQDCAEYGVHMRTDDNAAFIGLYAPEPGAASESVAALVAIVLCRRRASS